jgi:type I restriction enzyme R subunit/putative DNA methylase
MTPRTKKEYLLQLVTEKNRWSRPLTDEEKALGFLGWHERGYLPHCDFPGLVQFVTFRLADSMPASRRGEWEHLLDIEDVREKRAKLEEYLDRGVGECYLRVPRIAQLAEHSLLHWHGERYELLAW